MFAYVCSYLFMIWYINAYYIQVIEYEEQLIFLSGIWFSSVDFLAFLIGGLFITKLDLSNAAVFQCCLCILINATQVFNHYFWNNLYLELACVYVINFSLSIQYSLYIKASGELMPKETLFIAMETQSSLSGILSQLAPHIAFSKNPIP